MGQSDVPSPAPNVSPVMAGAVTSNGPERLPAPISSKIPGIFGLVVCFILLFVCVNGYVEMDKQAKEQDETMADWERKAHERDGGLMLLGLGMILILSVATGVMSLRQILGVRLCSECSNVISKNDATCSKCNVNFHNKI